MGGWEVGLRVWGLVVAYSEESETPSTAVTKMVEVRGPTSLTEASSPPPPQPVPGSLMLRPSWPTLLRAVWAGSGSWFGWDRDEVGNGINCQPHPLRLTCSM